MSHEPYIPNPEDFKKVKYVVDDSYENFLLVQPPTMPEDNPFDPFGQLADIINRDWSKYSPTKKVSALILDTFTEATEEINRFVGTSGRGNTGTGEVYGLHIDDAWATESMRVAQQYDYGKAQDLSIALLRMAMRSKQFPHVIVLGHRKEIYEEVMKRVGGKYQAVREIVGYDMSVPGRKWLGQMTKFAEQYVWQTNDGHDAMDIRLHLRSDGQHHTKFRTAQTIPGELSVPFGYADMADVIRELARYSEVDMGAHEPGLRLVSYGQGGTGKTMLWTSLPEETFKLGPAVYVPYDPSAARLTSVWPELRTKKAAA